MKKIEEKTIIGRVPTIEEHEAAAKESTPAEVKAPTLDDMQKKIALQQEHLNRLNGFFADRARFSKTRDDLKRFKSSIDAAIKSGCIESPQHRLAVWCRFALQTFSLYYYSKWQTALYRRLCPVFI